MKQEKTYFNHAFTIAFEVKNSRHIHGDDLSEQQIRNALIARVEDCYKSGLFAYPAYEAIGAPFDTYEQEGLEPEPEEDLKASVVLVTLEQEERIIARFAIVADAMHYAEEYKHVWAGQSFFVREDKTGEVLKYFSIKQERVVSIDESFEDDIDHWGDTDDQYDLDGSAARMDRIKDHMEQC